MNRIIAVACISFGVCAACLDLTDGCGNDILSDVTSPNREARAVVFRRNCGATTGFSTHVSVVSARAGLPDSSGNVLIIGGEYADARINVRWATSDTLEVLHNLKGGVLWADSSARGVAIRIVRGLGEPGASATID